MAAPFVFLESGDRAATVAGLREFAGFLEAHPEVPAPSTFAMVVYAFTSGYTEADEPACRAEVDRAAATMGVTPQSGRQHYHASRDFGPIRYRVVHIPADTPDYDVHRNHVSVALPDSNAADRSGVA